MLSLNRHVHSTISEPKSKHAASFDFRVGGAHTQVLIDSGANVSCIALALFNTLNLPIYPIECDDENMHGLGGAVKPVGTTTASIKIGKFHAHQKFIFLQGHIAGYECLLGEDFMMIHSASLVYSPNRISLNIGMGKDGTSSIASINRKLYTSVLTNTKHTDGKVVLPIGFKPALEHVAYDEP